MAKRPTSAAAKPREPATGRRSAKPTVAKAIGVKRTKMPAGKPAKVVEATHKAAETSGLRGNEGKTRKAVLTTDAAASAKSARTSMAEAQTAPRLRVPAAEIKKAAAKRDQTKSAKGKSSKATHAATDSAANKNLADKSVRAKAVVKVAKQTKIKAGSPKAAPPATPQKTGPRKARPSKRRPPSPAYLAAELGQPLDHDGEPVGAGAAIVASDRALQDYTLQLWRQMQSGRSINKHLQAVERAGLNLDDVWMVGVKETLKTTSTPEEAQLYRKKLLFRANLLEAILSETVSKLVRLDHRADVGGESEAS